MNFANQSLEREGIYNNIIYYDQNTDNCSSVNRDSEYLERQTPGAFILCTDLESLSLVRNEILKEIEKDEKITFNLITSGSLCTKIMAFLKEDENFENCINNVCIYCFKIEKYIPLKNIYNKIHDDIYSRRHRVAEFIASSSKKEIKPFPLTKLITYEDYIKIKKKRHFKISTFYGDLRPESYQKYIKEMNSLIEKNSESNELLKDKDNVFKGFLSFDFQTDIKALDVLIIKEFTKNSFYADLNKFLMNNKELYEPVAYFTARLMCGLNKYGLEKDMYSKESREFYYGAKIFYSSILPYKRAKGKIIILSSFLYTSEDITIAENFAGREKSNKIYKNHLKFSVLFFIKNNYKNGWVSSVVNVQDISSYKREKGHIFLPFTFYYVKDVKINIHNHIADIYLEAIGKKEILEEEIKKGKEIEYNKNDNIIQIKEN